MRSIISVVIIILAGALFFGYTKGAYDQIQASQQMSTQYDTALNKAAELQQVVTTLLAKYNAFNPSDLAHLQTMLPDQVNNIGLILDLDTLAQQYGLSLEGVDIGAQDSSASGSTAPAPAVGSAGSNGLPYDSLNVSFTIHGTYGQFTQFMEGLQQSLRIVDLVSISVTAGGTTDTTDTAGTTDTTTPPSLAQLGGSSSGASAIVGADSNVYAFNMTLRTYWLK